MSSRSPYKLPNSAEFAPSQSSIFYAVKIEAKDEGEQRLVALENVPCGLTFARDGGTVVSSIADVYPEKKYATLIDENLWLAPSDYENLDAISYINHSCDANLARIGGLVYITKKEIKKGDEITVDYAPLVSGFEGWTLECSCKAPNCRQTITSMDWKNPRIAKELWAEWLPFIQKRIVKG